MDLSATRARIFIAAFGIVMIMIAAPMGLMAQEYPTKPINLTVCIAVGGTVDLSTRILATKAEKFLGQPIMVTNNGGGAGAVAMDLLTKAKPDGYQIASCPQTPLVEIPHVRKLSYKLDDVVPVMQFAEPYGGLVVQTESPFKSFKDLVEYGRKNPGKVTYSTSGTLTPWHLAMMYVGKQENIQWTAIPVPGGDPNMPLLGGHVTAFTAASSWKRYTDQGKFRLLVVYSDKRMNAFPNVPTLKELGYDFVVETNYAIYAPAATPAPILKKLDDAFRKAMDDPEFIDYMKKAELPIVYKNSADTKKALDQMNKRFEKVVVTLKIPKEQ
ncbi:MAG TPA: tripartite tricarboxylate transporter substrate binding protein [Syntrophorhabdaceae bacterium]|nr:tripartite tricarboxylate transporter substrate binding protein [Syntrophorhabdaceae bacterium]